MPTPIATEFEQKLDLLIFELVDKTNEDSINNAIKALRYWVESLVGIDIVKEKERVQEDLNRLI